MDIREISLRLKRVQQGKQSAVDAALSSLESSLSQWVVLRRIRTLPGASAHDLAQASFQTDQSFGALVRRLIERGLVARKPGRGRATMHTLSPKGEKLLDRCEPIVVATLRKHFSALSAEELLQLGQLLKKALQEPATDPASGIRTAALKRQT
ncbi:MarR family winged helix-turn-helix transcriptional regulator [Mesorhizobium sp. A556]